mgnify:CR=1 FL=1
MENCFPRPLFLISQLDIVRFAMVTQQRVSLRAKQSPAFKCKQQWRLLRRCAPTQKLPLTPALSPKGRGSKSPLPRRERVRVRVGRFCTLEWQATPWPTRNDNSLGQLFTPSPYEGEDWGVKLRWSE